MDSEFEVINDSDEILSRLKNRDTLNNQVFFSTEIDGFTTDIRFFNSFIGESLLKDRHSLFDAILVRGGNLLSVESHISRLFKGMKDVNITPPFSENELEDIIIKLCQISGEKNGFVKLWISDAEPAHFYAIFNRTIASKPLVGASEWTFNKTFLDMLNFIGQKNTESLELNLASKGIDNSIERVVLLNDEEGKKAFKDVKLIIFSGMIFIILTGIDNDVNEVKEGEKAQIYKLLKYSSEITDDVKYLCIIDRDLSVIPVKEFKEKQFDLPSDEILAKIQNNVFCHM